MVTAYEKKKRSLLKTLLIILLVLVAIVCVFLIAVRCYFRLPVMDYYRASHKAFIIPDCNKGFVAQGLTYDEQHECYLVTGYMADGSASPVYVIDASSNKLKTGVQLATQSGEPFLGHAGGLSVYGDYVYIAGSHDYCLYVFSVSDILNATNGSIVRCLGTFEVGDDLSVAFTATNDGKLYVGEFYREANYPTPEAHKLNTPCGDYNQAIAVAYRFSDDPSAVFGLETDACEIIFLPDQVQGLAFHNGEAYLSISYGVSFSKILSYDIQASTTDLSVSFKGCELPLSIFDSASQTSNIKIAPMSEEIIFVGDSFYTMCESASNKYVFGKFTSARWCYATDIQALKK